MSFRLKMLGGATLLSDDGPVIGRATQRRRIALLALLGAAGEGGLSRDRLMALLWPESDAERGRHLLSDSVYRINQSLGDAIIAIGDALALNPDRVTTDLGEFSAAYAQGAWDVAISRYGGPLLDGFHVSEAVELERWIEVERERIATCYARALERLADDRRDSGDVLGAVETAKALATHDPLSARFALRYMRALDAAGERASAVRHARVYTALVEQELGVEPDIEIEALAERLSSAPAADRSEPVDAPAAQPFSAARSERADADALPGDEYPTAHTARPLPSGAADSTLHNGAPPREEMPPPGNPVVRTRDFRTAIPDGLRKRLAVAAGLLLFVALAAAAWVASRPAGSDSLPRSLAVLPFADLSPQEGQAYLSDGITEELIATLSRVPGLRVAARTSSFAFKDKPADIREVGARLGVETILEGSVRSSGRALRITAQLVNVRDGYPLWSETYERRLDDAFAVQDEITRQIVERLRPSSSGGDAPRAVPPIEPIDAVAYDLYLKGRYAWHQRTQAGLLESARIMEEAVKLAPRYARGHAGLGEAYAVLGFYDYMPPSEAFPRAAAAARGALALDSGLASPHATLAYVALYHDWEFTVAEREFRRAIAADSGYSTAHQWYGNLLTAMGRFPEAERAMRRAMELDPLSLIANAALGWVHYYAGEPRRAVEQFDRTLELDPDFQLALMWKGQAYVALKQFDSAQIVLADVMRRSGGSPLAAAVLAHARAAAGDAAGATALLAGLEPRADTTYLPAFEIARVHSALGRRDDALRWLERAAAERSHSIAFLTVDPALAPLRGDPRFEALVRLRSP